MQWYKFSNLLILIFNLQFLLLILFIKHFIQFKSFFIFHKSEFYFFKILIPFWAWIERIFTLSKTFYVLFLYVMSFLFLLRVQLPFFKSKDTLRKTPFSWCNIQSSNLRFKTVFKVKDLYFDAKAYFLLNLMKYFISYPIVGFHHLAYQRPSDIWYKRRWNLQLGVLVHLQPSNLLKPFQTLKTHLPSLNSFLYFV